jgi:hypothetical protein
MNELAVRDETAAAVATLPAAQLPVPAMSDIDSWTEIVGKVIRLANEIYDTPFIPDGLRGSAPAVAAAILAGREMGLGPMTSLANIDVIRGKPTQKPLLMRAMIQSRGHKWEDVENNDTRAVVRGCRKGEPNWTTVTFTADQAKRAGLDLGKYPADKLYARASSRLAKHRFADVIMGMPSSDDAEDGVDAEIGIDTGADAAGSGTAPAAIEAARPRTAQRAARKASPPAPAAAAQAAAAPAASGPRQDAGGDLPPLPGEEEDPTSAPPPGTASPPSTPAPDDTDYDTAGTVTKPQITRIWATLTGDIGYPNSDKDAARATCAAIIGRDLATSGDLSRNEAGTVIDTLSAVLDIARRRGGDPRAIIEGLTRDPRAAALTELSRLGITGTEAIADTAGAVLRIVPPASLESLPARQATGLAAMLARCVTRDDLDALLKAGEVPGGE